MTTTLTTPAATTDLLTDWAQDWLNYDEDRADAQKALDAAKLGCSTVVVKLEKELFGDLLTNEQKAQHTAKGTPIELPGGYKLTYRDYGKCAAGEALSELFAWIGANKTFSVKRILARWSELQVKHTKPSFKGIITAPK